MHDLDLDQSIPVRDNVSVHNSIHDVENSMSNIHSLATSSMTEVPNPFTLLGGNIDLLLHQVAQAAVQAQNGSKRSDERHETQLRKEQHARRQ